MDIVSALFTENFNIRPVAGPSTRIDLTGVMFSMPAPSPVPVTVTPHLVVLIRCRPDEPGQATLEVVFRNEAGDEVARNANPFQVEPGKFTYRLVRGELDFRRLRHDRGPLPHRPGPGHGRPPDPAAARLRWA